MNNRERLSKTFNHELPDRVPALVYARAEVERDLLSYYGVGSFKEVLQILGADTYARMVFDIVVPGFAGKTNGTLGGDCPGAGKEYIFHDERTFEDQWGVVRRVGSDGKYVQWITGPLAEAEDPDVYEVLAEPENLEWVYNFEGKDRIVDDDDLRQQIAEYQGQDLFAVAIVNQPFKTAWYLRGLENVLMDYLINRSFLEKLYDRIFELAGTILRQATSAGADMVGFDGDIAMQDRVIMGPESWRAVDKPRLAALIASCKEINPEVNVFIHSDGDIREILSDLIEIGFNVIDPIQPECMEPADIKRLYGDRIILHGCGSLQRTLPFGSPEDCRREVINLIRSCGGSGGLVLRVSNNIGYDVPVENVVAWYETVRDYRL